MKKIVVFLVCILSLNVFSAQILNDTTFSFLNPTLNKEVKALIFGNYNTEMELSVVSKKSKVTSESLVSASEDALSSMKKAAQKYSYEILKGYLEGAILTGVGFNNSKMKEFSQEVAEKVYNESVRRGVWSTSKNETVVLYTLSKERVREESSKLFDERLSAVINRLGEYQNTFNKIK